MLDTHTEEHTPEEVFLGVRAPWKFRKAVFMRASAHCARHADLANTGATPPHCPKRGGRSRSERDMLDWDILPTEVQDRILLYYKWSVDYVSYVEGMHEETWERFHPFLSERGQFAAGDWSGDPIYEKFLVLRPNGTIMVLDEFYPS